MKKIVVIIFSSVTLGGCATIFSGTDQPMQIVAKDKTGNNLNNVTCRVQTAKENLAITMVPGTVIIPRATKDIIIDCISADQHYAGSTVVSSHYNSTNLWNIGLTIPYIIPGVVGWSVDGISGADMEYPKNVDVNMLSTKDEDSSKR